MEKLRLLPHSPMTSPNCSSYAFFHHRRNCSGEPHVLVELPTMLANVRGHIPLTSPNLQSILWVQQRQLYPVEGSLSTMVLPIFCLVESHVVPPVVSPPKSPVVSSTNDLISINFTSAMLLSQFKKSRSRWFWWQENTWHILWCQQRHVLSPGCLIWHPHLHDDDARKQRQGWCWTLQTMWR